MGSLFSFFKRKKTTVETLEQIDKEIKKYEKYKSSNESNEKKYVGALLLYSIVLYIIGAVFYFIYLMPKNLVDRMKTLVPFFIMPFIIFGARKFLKWYYIKRRTTYAKKLSDLKEEKKSILEDVKEKETYKKAREILERFSTAAEVQITPPAPASPANNSMFTNSGSTPVMNRRMNETMLVNQSMNPNMNHTMNPNMNQTMNPNNLNSTHLVHRNVKQLQMNHTIAAGPTSRSGTLPVQADSPSPGTQSSASQIHSASAPSGPRTLPRPIIAPNRTLFDKLLDFMIGEGPNNRYALICKSCHFHNGMALKEEFEYVAFRCAYCLFYNEARKNKLVVPSQKSMSSVVDPNLNHSSASTSNLSSQASFSEEPVRSDADRVGEPVSEKSSSHKNIKSSSEKSLENLTLNQHVATLGVRRGSLTDSSNHIRNRIGTSRSSSTRSMERLSASIEKIEKLSREINNKENVSDVENMDCENILGSKKDE